jgi:myosin heavy subunit
MAQPAVIQLEVESEDALAVLEQVEQGLEEVDIAAVEAGDGFERLTAEVTEEVAESRTQIQSMASATRDMASASSTANNLTFELTNQLQDMRAAGLRGATNAIPMISEQFLRLKNQAGSTTGALSQMLSTFTGPTGILAIGTLGLQALPSVIDFFSGVREEAEKTSEEVKNLKEATDQLITGFESELPDFQIADTGQARRSVEGLEQSIQSREQLIEDLEEALGAAGAEQAQLSRGAARFANLADQTIQKLIRRNERVIEQERGLLRAIQDRLDRREDEVGQAELLKNVQGVVVDQEERTTDEQEKQTDEQEEQLTALEKRQEEISELRERLKILSRVGGQRLAQTRQIKEELKRKVEVQKQLNRLQQEALPKGFQTDSPGANVFTQQQSEEFARNLQSAARAIERMAARQQTMNQLVPDPGSVQAANLSLRQMQQVMGKITQRFGAGALDVEAFIKEIDRLGEKLQTFGLADTALQSVRAQINETKRALRVLIEKGADPSSEAVQDLRDKLESLQRQAVGLRIAQQAGLQLATRGFNQLGRAIAGAEDTMEKFKQTAASTLQTVGQILLQSAIAGPLGVPFAALGAGITVAGGALGFAEGGEVRGPGTSTSDSIPAVLSDREFVVNAGSAQMAPSALKAINEDPAFAGMIEQFVAKPPEQFATGGFVTIGEDDQKLPALPQGSRAAYGAETQQMLDQAKPISGELQIQLETEVKRLNKRELGLLVRTENERRTQFQI